MLKGIYIGKDKRLNGFSALLMEHKTEDNKYLAQFDSFYELATSAHVKPKRLKESHGWHSFDKSDFRLIENLESDNLPGGIKP